jgi:DNA-directed RNA polymerase subunit alpha
MLDQNIVLPSKPRIIREDGMSGTYEIDGFYPGYGHTIGNSLRRIILASIPGAAITMVRIKGAEHEFSTLPGVKEDVINILLNLKKVRMKVLSKEPQTLRLKVKGAKEVKASDIEIVGQVEILTPDAYIATVTDKNTELDIEITVEHGLGYVPREVHRKERVDIGTISLDAIFTPIRRASYEVENMRVGDRTDFNRLRVFIETDGTLTPREALESSINVMINQLKAIVGFKEESEDDAREVSDLESGTESKDKKEIDPESLKNRIESLGLGARTMNALANANIRTVGGLARKKVSDLEEIEGLGSKGIVEIREALEHMGIFLK